jgi:hypothetical protein
MPKYLLLKHYPHSVEGAAALQPHAADEETGPGVNTTSPSSEPPHARASQLRISPE